jgi:hypothetical protein
VDWWQSLFSRPRTTEKKRRKNEMILFLIEQMASSNNDIPLAILQEWYKIRDTFFGQNEVSRNVPLALELAASCQHPDARWLVEACAGKDVTTKEDAKRVFSALGQQDARALCFAWLCGHTVDEAPLRRSGELGFAWAQALISMMADGFDARESLLFAQLAAAQGERDGLYELGRCFREGTGCEQDLDKAKENYLLASKLGHVAAMRFLGDCFHESNPQRWRWWGQAAALRSESSEFLYKFVKQVHRLNAGSGNAVVVFAIGRALHGHVHEEERIIFTEGSKFDIRIGPAKHAIAFFAAQLKACRKAVDCWTLVGLRFGVVKDIRKLIAKLIWDSREEALYKLQ